MQIDFDWTPTADNVNALPEPLRRYICALETECDPSGTIMSEVHMRDDIIPALEEKTNAQAAEIERLEAEVVECERVCSALRRGDKP